MYYAFDSSEWGDSWQRLSRHIFAQIVRRVVRARPFDAGAKVAVSFTYIRQFPSRRQKKQVPLSSSICGNAASFKCTPNIAVWPRVLGVFERYALIIQ